LAALLGLPVAASQETSLVIPAPAAEGWDRSRQLDGEPSGHRYRDLVVTLEADFARQRGFLTAFVLNNPDDAITSISNFVAGAMAPVSLIELSDNGGATASPLATSISGATTGGILGGGNPSTGWGGRNWHFHHSRKA
jgi:hypothetical protein